MTEARIGVQAVTIPMDFGKIPFSPSTSMAPHHFRAGLTIEALLPESEWPTIELAQQEAYCLQNNSQVDPIYFRDIFGPDSRVGLSHYTASLTRYYALLRRLPNDSYIHLDIKPDGICNSCVVGKHCTAVNYKTSTNPEGAVTEAQALGTIRGDLEILGFERGIDFITVFTLAPYYDYGSQELNKVRRPRKVLIPFNSMIVRTGALREVGRYQKELDRAYLQSSPETEVLTFGADPKQLAFPWT